MAAAVDGSAVAAAAVNTNSAAAAGQPAQQPPASGTPAAAPASPWFASIEDPETRGYIENKAWKSPVEAIKSYRELESTFSKVRGAPPDRLVVLPGPEAKPEDWAPVYDRLGRPKSAEDYKLVGMDGTSTDPFAQQIGPVMHTIGITAAQAKALNVAYNQYGEQLIAQQQKDRDAQWAADDTVLHQEWPGQVYGERMALAKRAAQSYGFDETTINQFEQVLGPAKVYRWFAKIGEGQGEGGKGFEAGTPTNTTFGLTPEGARAQIVALKADKEFGKRYLNGDAEAVARFQRLEQIASASNGGTVVR